MIGLSLCPFAKVPYRSGSVRVEVYEGAEEARYLAMIQAELERLITCSTIETTLIAATNVLPGFLDFNDFLDPVEDLLQKDNLDMEFQLASFHPQYHFAGVGEHDPGNYTNRAPFPLVQWLRSDTVATAADATDTLAIPQHNIARLSGLDASQLQSLFPWVKTSDSDA